MKDKTMMQYISNIKTKCHIIAVSGSPLLAKDIVLYIFNGLSSTYQAFKMAIQTNFQPIS